MSLVGWGQDFPIIKFKEPSTLRTYFDASRTRLFVLGKTRRLTSSSYIYVVVATSPVFAGHCGTFLFFSDASEIAAKHSIGMSHICATRNTQESNERKNKEELKGLFISRNGKELVKVRVVPKVRHKFGPNGISAFFIPFFFLFVSFLKFCFSRLVDWITL